MRLGREYAPLRLYTTIVAVRRDNNRGVDDRREANRGARAGAGAGVVAAAGTSLLCVLEFAQVFPIPVYPSRV